MPKKTIASVEAELAHWKELYKGLDRAIEAHKGEIAVLNARIRQVAAENETLLADKKWLQQMHSAQCQSILELMRSRNALPR